MFSVNVASQNISISSSLNIEGKRFVCPGEIAIYTCSGRGNEIDVYVPPYINSTSAVSFVRGDNIGIAVARGPVFTSLASTEVPMMETNIQLESSSQSECVIFCEIRSPFQADSVVHQLSGILD